MIRVIVADDHAVVRRGLRDLLEDEPDIRVVAEAAHGREALDCATRSDWDVLVLDIAMPELNGLEVADRLCRQKPDLAILILSMHSEEQFAVRALRAGARGYLTKECAAQELVAAVRVVAAGRRYISRELSETLAARLAGDDLRLVHEALSDRELEVMCLLAGGKATAEIAKALFLSPKTVATYRQRLMRKMGLRTIAEITRYAVQNGLVD